GAIAPPVSTAPRVKRSRLEVARELRFGPGALEEPPSPHALSPDITPPPSPEVPAELWDEGALRAGAGRGLLSASQAARNPVLKRPPVLDDYVHVTSTGGVRVFLLLRADPLGTGVQSPLPAVQWRGRGQLDLLGVSFASLKEQVDSEVGVLGSGRCFWGPAPLGRLTGPGVCAAAAAAAGGAGGRAGQVSALCPPHPAPPRGWGSGLWLSRGSPEEEVQELEPAGSQDAPRHWLWVDEFAPRCYRELLSDDFTNRCLLKWLKLWDPVVFGRERPARRPRPSLEPARAAKEAPAAGKWKSREQVLEEMLEAELDGSGRPRQKVALLCGPPGLGKTTLAHVIARHAGYCVVEMNASDDRSPEAFRTRIEAATQMESVLGAGGKPNCLVIDEIDGAPTISLRQGMQVDPGALAALCEKTDRDIRACINTLQFLHRRGQRDLSVQAVQATHVGLKDQRKGLFSVWQEVFQLPRAHRRQDAPPPAHTLLTGDGHPVSGPYGVQPPLTMASQRFLHVLHVATSAGEHERVAQGLFDNFLRLRLRDSGLGAVCAALDWLAFDDLLQRAALQGQRFQLLRYGPFLPAAFHVLLATSRVPRLNFPSSQQEAQGRTQRTQNLIQTLVSGIAPATRSRAAPQALVLDALCLLLDIVAPKLRPVSTQLYSAREKQQLASLVGTMLAYSLTYRQERAPDGQYVYRLEPDVEAVCRFPELPARRPLTYQAKQLIAREIELERMRRAEALAGRGPCPQVAELPPGCPEEEGARAPAQRGQEQPRPRVLKQAAREEQPERDFFGRVVVRRAAALSAGLWGGAQTRAAGASL
ncbi:PREDICTED: chromosome transmission fidelity protein 18 homolog, partial [Condylura cristata]|uniref:chromosome transmission fidelity protein 18 homolog n=1 Tax=Condylura cristata TaxID=143302 RepID=UPI000643005D